MLQSYRAVTSDMLQISPFLLLEFRPRNFAASLHRQSFSRCNSSRKSAIFFRTDSSKRALNFYGDRFYALSRTCWPSFLHVLPGCVFLYIHCGNGFLEFFDIFYSIFCSQLAVAETREIFRIFVFIIKYVYPIFSESLNYALNH